MSEVSVTNILSKTYLDPSILRGLEELSFDEGESLFEELAGLFEETIPELLTKLKQALIQKNAEQVRQLSHRIKGSAANLGAMKMAELCSNMERSAKSASPQFCTDAFDQIQKTYLNTCVEISMHIASRSSKSLLPK